MPIEVSTLIQYEWDMLQEVVNVDGRADCQDDPHTFAIMRKSQFEAWEPEVRESYFEDLQIAKSEGRNLLFEKYAHMMQNTEPWCISAAIALPEISADKERQVQALNKRMLLEAERCAQKYPKLMGRGRPLHAGVRDKWDISIETYQIGELRTYSERTLSVLTDQIDQWEADGRSLVETILLNTVLHHGYTNLEQAEESLRNGGYSIKRFIFAITLV